MPTPARARRELGFYVNVIDQYGTREIFADVVYKATAADTADADEIGQSFDPRFDWRQHPARDFDAFQVRAHMENGRCFGLRHGYFKPNEVGTARAEAMTRVLRRVDRSMKATQEEDGYLADGDFTAHLLRVARAIDAHYFDWRPFARAAIERTDAEGIGSVIDGFLRATAPIA